MPWFCGGDFNEFLWDYEKKGGREVCHGRPRYLQNFIDTAGLIDLGFNGPCFTWRGMRNGELVEERLDRGLVNERWQECWPDTIVTHCTVFMKSWKLHCDGNGLERWQKKVKCLSMAIKDMEQKEVRREKRGN